MTGEFIAPGSNNEISGTGYQIAITEVDPTTGLPRLIFGNNYRDLQRPGQQGDVRDHHRQLDATPAVNRNGNLDLAQFYYGAVQPSSAAAQAAGALFYGGAQNIGGQASDRAEVGDGNIQWSTIGLGVPGYIARIAAFGDPLGGTFWIASGTAVDEQGQRHPFQYWSPGQGGDPTDFVMVNGISRTFGLLQASNGLPAPDPQWTITGDEVPPRAGRTSSSTRSTTQDDARQLEHRQRLRDHEPGQDLVRSRHPGNLRQPTTAPATSNQLRPGLGAPDPRPLRASATSATSSMSAPAEHRHRGQIYVTQNAGGNWTNISTGLDGSRSPGNHHRPRPGQPRRLRRHRRRRLSTWPTRSPRPPIPLRPGSTSPAASRPWPIPSSARATTRRPTRTPRHTTWRRSSTRSRPTGTTPSPIIRSTSAGIPSGPLRRRQLGRLHVHRQRHDLDPLPRTTFGAVAKGGYLPHVNVTDLSLSQGNVAVATGMPNLAGPYNPEEPQFHGRPRPPDGLHLRPG